MSGYIVLWCKPAPDNLDWDFYVAGDVREAEKVVANIKRQGVHKFSTRPIGDKIADLSSEY